MCVCAVGWSFKKKETYLSFSLAFICFAVRVLCVFPGTSFPPLSCDGRAPLAAERHSKRNPFSMARCEGSAGRVSVLAKYPSNAPKALLMSKSANRVSRITNAKAITGLYITIKLKKLPILTHPFSSSKEDPGLPDLLQNTLNGMVWVYGDVTELLRCENVSVEHKHIPVSRTANFVSLVDANQNRRKWIFDCWNVMSGVNKISRLLVQAVAKIGMLSSDCCSKLLWQYFPK